MLIASPKPTPLPHRRHAIVAGMLGTAGLTLPQLLAAESGAKPKREKTIIMIVPWGGPCQLDTLDPKPDAPAEIRSIFKPIPTTIPGFQISERLPKLADLAKHYSVVRSASHNISTHNSATHYVFTGHKPAITNRELVPANRSDYPCIGSVLSKLQPSATGMPSYVVEPCPLIDQNTYTGGQHAGFLGVSHDPFLINKDPDKADFQVDGLTLTTGLTLERLDNRRRLLDKLAGNHDLAPQYAKAYGLLASPKVRDAFDIQNEPAKTRERYGKNRFGQSVLLARRLAESGVRLIMVSDTITTGNDRWDTHGGNSYPSIGKQLDETDLALSALLTELTERGLLDSTIVLWMAEFGRTPKMNKGGGRDHWPNVYSFLAAGGGIAGGRVHGASDNIAGYPRDNPVSPEDIQATLYHLLGVPLDTVIHDPANRPVRMCEGKPIAGILA